MYSFGNRHDFVAVDEPFYAYYLHKHPEVNHPGRDEVLRSQSVYFNEVLENVIFADYGNRKLFVKNMAHHLHGADWQFMSMLHNIILIRNPRELIASFARVIENPTMLDIGVKLEYEILQYSIAFDIPFVVIDSGELRQDPESYIAKLCAKIGIDFEDNMIRWKAGPRKEDGIWAKFWYSNVHKSTGFSAGALSKHPFPDHLEPLLAEANTYYEQLSAYKI